MLDEINHYSRRGDCRICAMQIFTGINNSEVVQRKIMQLYLQPLVSGLTNFGISLVDDFDTKAVLILAQLSRV